MWCVWWDEWLLGVCWCESEVRDACPFILLPPPCVFFWRPEHSLVMEDVSVAHDLSFKPGLGGEGKSIWNLKKLSKLL